MSELKTISLTMIPHNKTSRSKPHSKNPTSLNSHKPNHVSVRNNKVIKLRNGTIPQLNQFSPRNRITSKTSPYPLTPHSTDEIEKYQQQNKLYKELTVSIHDKLEKSNFALEEVLSKANEYKQKYKKEHSKCITCHNENNTLKKTISSLENELQIKTNKIDELNKTIQHIETQKDNEIIKLKQQIELLNKQNKAYAEESTNFDIVYTELENKHNELKMIHNEQVHELEKMYANEKAYNKEKEEIEEENEKLVNQMKDKENDLEKIKEMYEIVNKENQMKERIIEEIKKERDLMEDKLNEVIELKDKEIKKIVKEMKMKDEEVDDIIKDCEYKLSLKDDEIEYIKEDFNNQIKEFKEKLAKLNK
jgi:epidermal growth factor receptor substrate 15